MAINPNVPYEIYQDGKYVSLPTASAPHNTATPLMPSSQYRAFEEKYNKLSHDTREILGKLAWAASAAGFSAAAPRDPLSGMSPARRDMVIADLKKHGVGWYDEKDRTFDLDDDAKAIVRDLRGGKKGFNTPVYNVAGQPVAAHHFDDAGNLSKALAKACGVPSNRRETIAARTPGIRKDLLLPPRPVIRPLPAGPGGARL